LSIPKTLSGEKLVDAVVTVLAKNDKVILACLYGAIVREGQGNDIDQTVRQLS
jgi:hypothetical protein